MKKSTLKKYAKLIAVMGANVQKDQEVTIYAGLDQPEFVKMVVEECYKLKAKKVVVEWDYPALDKLHYKYQKLKTLGTVEDYEIAKLQHRAETLPCRIILISDDPDGLKGINQEKMAKASQMRYPIIKPFRNAIENKHQWCIAAVPGEAWAKKLFPKLRKSQAIEKLWEAILHTSRVWEEAGKDDPLKEWEKHSKNLKDHCAYLNSLGIKELRYHNELGTDFRVGMIPQAQFCGGSEDTKQGVTFQPNIPTEEVFISPMKGDADGIVYATKPLSYQGQLINDFWIRFKDGKAIEWDAKENAQLLTKMITMDEGSCYLGECALVPYESPICESGILFYNTLFDENAVCHLALGMGFPDTIKGFMDMSLDEVHALGINDSMIHEDFMIGSRDLSIDAICEDGKTVPIFRGGTWVK